MTRGCAANMSSAACTRMTRHKLRYLSELRLEPGSKFRLVARAPFMGPLQLRVNGKSRHLGHELAGDLRVCSEAEYRLVLAHCPQNGFASATALTAARLPI